MGHYYSIKGWLECSYEDVDIVKEVVKSSNIGMEKKNVYDQCWHYPLGGANWTAYIFFGCDLKSYRMEYFENLIDAICANVNELDGYFEISDDEGTYDQIMRIRDGKIIAN